MLLRLGAAVRAAEGRPTAASRPAGGGWKDNAHAAAARCLGQQQGGSRREGASGGLGREAAEYGPKGADTDSRYPSTAALLLPMFNLGRAWGRSARARRECVTWRVLARIDRPALGREGPRLESEAFNRTIDFMHALLSLLVVLEPQRCGWLRPESEPPSRARTRNRTPSSARLPAAAKLIPRAAGCTTPPRRATAIDHRPAPRRGCLPRPAAWTVWVTAPLRRRETVFAQRQRGFHSE